ncbi:MAG: LuxR C-terminal-related transcriptional regulator [Actinomycetota bacterium]|nr:LuxR C-terminal-related transcriptional regulator [Actinomycetota bacterium]
MSALLDVLPLSQGAVAIPVLVFAKDPISRAGVTGQLRHLADITVLDPSECRDAEVAVIVVDAIDDEVLRVIRTIRRTTLARIIVVSAAVTSRAAAAATDAGAAGLLPRSSADHLQLASAIRKARRGESVTESPEGRGTCQALRHDRTCRSGCSPDPLSARDRDVLRCLAEGLDTSEIARQLAYSEPTIKNVIQRLFDQLQARNRPHAVAIALRAGII